MLPVGLIGFMLTKKLEGGFYADPPKNKFCPKGVAQTDDEIQGCNRIVRPKTD